MLGVAHFGSAQQNEFDTYLLDSIAAVVVGGTPNMEDVQKLPFRVLQAFIQKGQS